MSIEDQVKDIMSNMALPVSNDIHSCPVDVKRQLLSIDFDVMQCEINGDIGEEYEALILVRTAMLKLLMSFPTKDKL